MCLLEWIIETQSYSVTELTTVGATDAELEQRICAYLKSNPLAPTRAVWEHVKGTNERISRLLKEGERFDCVPGPRGAKLWFIAATDSESTDSVSDSPNQWDENRMNKGNE